MRKSIVSAAFFAVVYVIFAFVHPEWCSFHEQYQMFLFGWDYLASHLCIASGMADYVAEFLVQFFIFPKLGAALWAALLLALALLISRLAGILAPDGRYQHFPLALLPPALLCMYCGDYNVMLAFPVSLVLSLTFALIYNRLPLSCRPWIQAALLPLVYWVAGYGVFLYLPVAVLLDWRFAHKRSFRKAALELLGSAAFLFAVIMIVAYTAMRQYPVSDVFFGEDFYRVPMHVPAFQHWILVSAFVAVAALVMLPACRLYMTVAEAVAMIALPLGGLHWCFDGYSYRLLKIDYLVRNQEWESVVRFCEANPPDDAMANTGLNLALAKSNQLTSRMFNFHQEGIEGLVLPFESNMVSGVISGDACLYLGLLNSAHRYYFDSQESILNCNKSGRLSKGIAIVHVLRGKHGAARRYINMLHKTLFYRDCAQLLDKCIENPSLISENPDWKSAVDSRVTGGVFVNPANVTPLFSELLSRNPSNGLALQYLLAANMLSCNLEGLAQALETAGVQGQLTLHTQEAAAMLAIYPDFAQRMKPEWVTAEVGADFEQFIKAVRSNPNSPDIHNGRWAKTFWYYFVVKSYN